MLDYFGSSVNFAARLAAVSSGGNLVVSEAVLNDPDVALATVALSTLEG